MIKDAGVMWNGVPAAKSGAIIIGILLGTMVTFVIDKRLDKVGITALTGYVLSCFGFITRILSTFKLRYRIPNYGSVIIRFTRWKKYMVQGT